MPIIETRQGNLLRMFKQGHFDAIAHGCNCFHTMGAGIAGQIAKEFPAALTVDKQTKFSDYEKLGTFSMISTEYGIIYNAYTQYRPGREDTNRLYKAIRWAFSNIDDMALGIDPVIGIPKIGAGIAGGDWTIIEKIINDVTFGAQIVVVEWDGS